MHGCTSHVNGNFIYLQFGCLIPQQTAYPIRRSSLSSYHPPIPRKQYETKIPNSDIYYTEQWLENELEAFFFCSLKRILLQPHAHTFHTIFVPQQYYDSI